MFSILNSTKISEIDSLYHSAPSDWNFHESYYKDTKKFISQIEPHLKSSWKVSAEKIKELQFKRIQTVIENAFHDVPFYNKLYSEIGFHPKDLRSWKDFNSLPIVHKTDLLSVPLTDIISQKYPLAKKEATEGRSVFSFPLLYNTNGSSGTNMIFSISPFRVLFDTLMGYRQMDFQSKGQYEHLREYSLHIECSKWWIEIDDYKRVNMHTIYVHDSPEKYLTRDRLHRLLSNHKIRFLSTYPSILEKIMNWLDLSKYSLKLVTIHSEQSTQSQRDEFSEKIKTPVLDEYSSQELTRIALQCPMTHEYIIEEDHNYIESVNSHIIGTSLINDSTPFIRYDQNDLGAVEQSDKYNFRVVKNFQGRENDSILLPNDEYVSSGEIIDQIYRWRENIDFDSCIVIQPSTNKLQLYIDKRTPLSEKEYRYIDTTIKNITMALMNIEIIEDVFHGDKHKTKKSYIIRRDF